MTDLPPTDGSPPADGKPRCGAQTRTGRPCRAYPVRNKTRCRMHGGSKRTGAPLGNRNALRHGYYAKRTQKVIGHWQVRLELAAGSVWRSKGE